ncbi:MAG: hypothetical protein RLZZ113_731, partial [Pseudomonadota bacterium]
LNYLARLGWSHGDDEIFSLDQLKTWFTLEHCSKSAAQFDFEKLKWLNNHYLRQKSGAELALRIQERVREEGFSLDKGPALAEVCELEEGFSLDKGPALAEVCELLKDRANTLNELAEEVTMFYVEPVASSTQLEEKMQPIGDICRALSSLISSLPAEWTAAALSAQIKLVLAETGLKMPQLAMPLRLILMGRTDTPSIDKVMAVLGRACVERRIQSALDAFR